jgi:hypothetical protein
MFRGVAAVEGGDSRQSSRVEVAAKLGGKMKILNDNFIFSTLHISNYRAEYKENQ